MLLMVRRGAWCLRWGWSCDASASVRRMLVFGYLRCVMSHEDALSSYLRAKRKPYIWVPQSFQIARSRATSALEQLFYATPTQERPQRPVLCVLILIRPHSALLNPIYAKRGHQYVHCRMVSNLVPL